VAKEVIGIGNPNAALNQVGQAVIKLIKKKHATYIQIQSHPT